MNDEDFNAFRARQDIDLVGPATTVYLELSRGSN